MRRFVVALLVVVSLAVLPASALAFAITNVVFTPPSPADLDFEENVTFTFEYESEEEARIFGRPLEGGSPAFGWAAHPSPAYSAGTGSGSGFFTIRDLGQGVSHVDQVRFRIYDLEQENLLHEEFVNVDFTFGSAAAAIPEPASVVLLLSGLAGIAGRRLRR